MTNKARGSGRGTGGSAQGDGGAKYCVCSKCGYSQKHVRSGEGKSVPCAKLKCPKCGTTMKGSDTKPISKPYPNFHSARVKSPGLFVRIRVLQTTKEDIMLYGGPLKSDRTGPTKIQAIRFPKKTFSPKEAKAWLKNHKQKYIMFEPAKVTKSFHVWEGLWEGLMDG